MHLPFCESLCTFCGCNKRITRKHSVESPYLDAVERELAMVHKALSELPLKCRQAFTMHRNLGLSYPEISEALGVSTSMVEKYIIQALKAFRTRLADAESS